LRSSNTDDCNVQRSWVSFSKRKNPLPCEKSLFLLLDIAFHALNGFASQCSGQSCGTAEQKKNKKTTQNNIF